MEAAIHNPIEERTPAIIEPQPAPLDVIRTETVLSKLPVHNLAKKGRVNIQISKTGPDGKVELKWEVSYSDRYGQARPLAYKLDTIIIDPKIEEVGRPLPAVLKLGSLRQFCAELGLVESGKNIKDIKRAFHQNASAYITAKFKYKGNDGIERNLEAGFTRYSVIFTGEELPDGGRADAVHIAFSPPYQEVLNNAPVRPLDLAYKKLLPPAAQRFYEIVSYQIFAALKYGQPTARLAYSEYCTFSAQQRYFERQPAQNQMNRIHREHKQSGYITHVRYEETTDQEGRWDCMLYYTPGPKARAEYSAFISKKFRSVVDVMPQESLEGGSTQHPPRRPRQRLLHLTPIAGPQQADYRIIAELAKRGIGETDARQLLATLPPTHPVLDQLEWGDLQIEQAHGKIQNPPGFYISLLQRNVPVPPTFESSRARIARQTGESAQSVALQQQRLAAQEAEEVERQKLDSQIATLTESDRQALLYRAKTELLASYPGMAHFFKANPNAINDGAVHVRMRQLISQGWKPHQPIK